MTDPNESHEKEPAPSMTAAQFLAGLDVGVFAGAKAAEGSWFESAVGMQSVLASAADLVKPDPLFGASGAAGVLKTLADVGVFARAKAAEGSWFESAVGMQSVLASAADLVKPDPLFGASGAAGVLKTLADVNVFAGAKAAEGSWFESAVGMQSVLASAADLVKPDLVFGSGVAGALKALADVNVFAGAKAADIGLLTQIGAAAARDWSDRLANGGDQADVDAEFEEMAAAWAADLPERSEQLTKITRNDELLAYGVAYCGLNWPPRTHEGTQVLGLIVGFTIFVAVVIGLIAVPVATTCVLTAGGVAYGGRKMTIKWSEHARAQLDSAGYDKPASTEVGEAG